MDIPDYDDYYKKGLTFFIEFYLHNNGVLNFDNEYFDFATHYDLINYLQESNDKYKLSIHEKNRINKQAKIVLQYCKDFRNDDFNCYFKLAESISMYGDLSAVRKCVNGINRYPNKPYTIDLQFSVFYRKNIKKKKYVNLKFDNFKYNKYSSRINFL
tara:strand:- start:1496 stop:1966 length:471 start_codon:yes stop_codon:yes gene_type:complete